MSTLLQTFSTVSGFPGEVFVLAFAFVLILVRSSVASRRRTLRNVLFLFAAFLLFRAAGSIVKIGLALPRPCWDPAYPSLVSCPESFSFPSGHALGSAMVAMIVGCIVRKKTVWIIGMMISFLIAASRVALGVHAPLDVLGGLALGYIFGWISWRLFWHE